MKNTKISSLFPKRGNLDSEMPTIHAISGTVYLASLSAISFIFDTISSEDVDFGLPDLDEFSIDPNPESNFFFFYNRVTRHF